MDIVFNITRNFEKDLKKFSSKDQLIIKESINKYSELYLSGNTKNFNQVYKVKLIENYQSSLYSLRVNRDIRVILTMDDDPLFDRMNVTLFGVIQRSDLNKSYRRVMESLYQKFSMTTTF